jgi:hypothetical protein
MFKAMHADTLDETPAEPPTPGPAEPPAGPSAPMHARSGVSEVARTTRVIPTARVNLMPPEVLMGRRVKRVKRRVVVAVVLVVAGSVAGLGWFKMDASRATADILTEQAAVEALRVEQLSYAELLKNDTVARDIDNSLASVMGDDVAWESYLVQLAASAPVGVQVTGVTAAVDGIGIVEEGMSLKPSGDLDGSGQEHIGSLTVVGLAPTHEVVAEWVNSLTSIEGFLVPYILGSTLAADGSNMIAFTIEITLSSALRNMRYAVTIPGTTTEGQGG